MGKDVFDTHEEAMQYLRAWDQDWRWGGGLGLR